MPREPQDTPRIITPLPKELLAAIDDYRFERRIASRSAAIRELIEAGLEAKRGQKAPGGG